MASYHGTKNLTYDHVGKKAHKTEALKKKKDGEFEKWRSSRSGTHSKKISKKLGIPLHED